MNHKTQLLLNANEYEVDSLHVLQLAQESGCSACDCEFIYLAIHTGPKLVTADKQILGKFPEVAVSAREFVDG